VECPYCHADGAYVGVIHVKCINPKCEHFDETMLQEKLEESEERLSSTFNAYDVDYHEAMSDYVESDDYYSYILSRLLRPDLSK